jgi:hypothetical protein
VDTFKVGDLVRLWFDRIALGRPEFMDTVYTVVGIEDDGHVQLKERAMYVSPGALSIAADATQPSDRFPSDWPSPSLTHPNPPIIEHFLPTGYMRHYQGENRFCPTCQSIVKLPPMKRRTRSTLKVEQEPLFL